MELLKTVLAYIGLAAVVYFCFKVISLARLVRRPTGAKKDDGYKPPL